VSDNYDGLIAHFRAEIDRLTTLHRAEQEHNRRLLAACSLYRSAAEVGVTALWHVSENGSVDDRNEIGDMVARADAIAIPTATEVPT
jgi:purine nucleoside phosphorylase